jgi:oxygen-independent coproporphyrinogen-3 oxidase
MAHELAPAPLFSFSVDLISGLPGLTLKEWNETLRRVVDDFDPPHLSIYDLQVEDGTVFGGWYGGPDSGGGGAGAAQRSSGRHMPLALPSDDESASMYRLASEFLRSRGYEHYEVSSYAKLVPLPISAGSALSGAARASPHRSRHNQVYWSSDGSWHAFGMGSTSYLGGRTVARPRALSDYLRWVRSLEEGAEGGEVNGLTDLPSEAPGPIDLDAVESVVLKRLRTREGLDLVRDVELRFGRGAVDAILRGSRPGLELGLVVLDEDGSAGGGSFSNLRLSVPGGFLLSNSILSSIFVELEDLYRHREG